MLDVISRTSKYFEESAEEMETLLSQWQALIAGCGEEWARLVQGPCLTITEGDNADENLEPDEGIADPGYIDHNW